MFLVNDIQKSGCRLIDACVRDVLSVTSDIQIHRKKESTVSKFFFVSLHIFSSQNHFFSSHLKFSFSTFFFHLLVTVALFEACEEERVTFQFLKIQGTEEFINASLI
ncbi:hypothetical protein VNO80_21920 [Phaseolus coccineus]|uniref:Uncharacterized protein n=1 Tax=Phaseolus coccineus TaxID=3886 RepID=A0AAN9QRC2_PHACN